MKQIQVHIIGVGPRTITVDDTISDERAAQIAKVRLTISPANGKLMIANSRVVGAGVGRGGRSIAVMLYGPTMLFAKHTHVDSFNLSSSSFKQAANHNRAKHMVVEDAIVSMNRWNSRHKV